MDGNEVNNQYCSPLKLAITAATAAAHHEALAAEAAAAHDQAAAAAARQKAAEYRAEAEQLTASAEQHAPALDALGDGLPQAAVLLRCVLQALGSFKSHAR
jgi:hypothetical protein